MVVLVGSMAAGKTPVGSLLADRLGLPFLDTDPVIESRAGRPIREIFATDGEPAFRALEHEVTADLLQGQDAVIALGGGGVEHPATRRCLAGRQVVYLRVGYEEAMLRVSRDDNRPMLHRPDLNVILRRRQSNYEAVATQIVATGGRRPEAISLDIIKRLVRMPSVSGAITPVLMPCADGTCGDRAPG